LCDFDADDRCSVTELGASMLNNQVPSLVGEMLFTRISLLFRFTFERLIGTLRFRLLAFSQRTPKVPL
jgi:hypothetical protein